MAEVCFFDSFCLEEYTPSKAGRCIREGSAQTIDEEFDGQDLFAHALKHFSLRLPVLRNLTKARNAPQISNDIFRFPEIDLLELVPHLAFHVFY